MSGDRDRYPTFAESEFADRRAQVRETMDDEALDVLLVYGSGAHGHAHVRYLSGYTGHGSSYLVFFADPDDETTLFYGISNHGQYARSSSVIEDVRWEGYPITDGVIRRVEEAGADDGRIGLVGVSSRHDELVPHGHYVAFERSFSGELVDATGAFERLLYVKSEAEIEWLRRGAELTDRGLEALVDAAEPGVSEYELRAAYESAFLERGGELFTVFVTSAPMEDADPGQGIVWQEPSARVVEAGDVITTELSASYHGYPGQIHRPIAVGCRPSPIYRELYDVVHEAYHNVLDVLEPGNGAVDVAEAMAPIEESEHKLYDVAFHGFGTTLQPPFVGTSSEHSRYWPARESPTTANWIFEENHVVTIQPNAVTLDERYGLQLGTTAVIRDDGPEVLHEFPVEFVEV